MGYAIIWQKIQSLLQRTDTIEQTLFDKIYPIGSVYISFSTTPPEVLFGGTWEQLDSGKVLLSSGTGYVLNSTGGNANITLTTDQLPSHTHSNTVSTDGAHAHSRGTMEITGELKTEPNVLTNIQGSEINCIVGEGKGALSTIYESSIQCSPNPGTYGTYTWNHDHGFSLTASNSWTGSTSETGNHSHTVTSGNTGGGQSISVMQPYISANMWRRIA